MNEEIYKNIEKKLNENKNEILEILKKEVKNEKDEKENSIFKCFWEFFSPKDCDKGEANYDGYEILIPSIQRNYVQGLNEKIRTKLVEDIFMVLNEKKEFVNLDIIYGVKIKNKFIPIDGQQRLTTLFLLYWYIFAKNNKFNLIEQMKFIYDNRESSKEFFELMTNKDAIKRIICDENCKKISDKIRNSTKFYSNKWDKDITIQSALKMLDEIENYYDESNKSYISILTDVDNPLIFFKCKFLDEKEDAELYIKMNSRGKVLSEYEILKATLENIALEYYKDSNSYLDLCSKFDNEWANKFLKKIEKKDNSLQSEEVKYSILEKVENTYKNFLKKFIIYYFLENIIVNKDDKDELIMEDKNFDIDFKNINKNTIKCDFFKKLENIMENLEFIYSNMPKGKLRNIKEIIDLEELWSINMENENASLKVDLYFYSIIKYLENSEFTKNLEDEAEYDKFQNWIRVMRNYINNSGHIQIKDKDKKESTYYKIIKKICSIKSELLTNEVYENNILNYINSQEAVSNINDNESKWLKYEKIKAEKILDTKNPKWKKIIIEADKDRYLKGLNFFLFEFIKDEPDENKIDTFEKYQKIVNGIFKEYNDETIDDEKTDSKESDFLLQRAMLEKEDYFKESYDSTKIFFVYKHPDNTNTWISILNEIKDNNEVLEKFKNFIDENILDLDNYNSDNINKRLKQIIDKSTKDANDWRYYFIKEPGLFRVCKQGLIQVKENNNTTNIYLIKTQRNSKLWDYITKILEIRLNKLGFTTEYLGKTGCNAEQFKYEQNLKIKEKNKEYVIIRNENGKFRFTFNRNNDDSRNVISLYKDNLKEIDYSFKFNVKLNNKDLNDKEFKEFIEIINRKLNS